MLFRTFTMMLALLFASGAWVLQPRPSFSEEAAEKPGTTDTLWSAKFKDLDGKEQSFDQYKGKVLIVYFWATWCVPCHKEAPHLAKLYEANKSKNLVVVGVAVDNADKVRKFVADNKLTNPTVYGGNDAVQLGRDLGNSLGAIPFSVIISKDGKIVETVRGDAPEGKVEGIIAPLLG